MAVTFGLLGFTPRKQPEVDGSKRQQPSITLLPGIVIDRGRQPDEIVDPGSRKGTGRDNEVDPPTFGLPIFSPITLGSRRQEQQGTVGRVLDLIF